MDYNKEYAKKVYAGLKKRGYTDADLGEEELFVTRMGREENRRYLYDLVTERGDVNIGSWERFNTRMTEQPTVESGGVIPYLENLSGVPYPQKKVDKSQYTFTSSQLGIEEPKPVVSGKGVRGLDLSDVERPYTQKREYGQAFDEAVENVEKFHRMRYGDGGTLVAPGVYKDGDVYRTAGGTAKKLTNANYKAYKAQVESDITDMMALYEQIGATPYGQLDTSEWGKYVDAMELGGEGRSRGARRKQEWQNRMRENYLLPARELPAEMSITKPQGYSAALRLLPILSLPEEEGKKILGEEGYNALKFFKAYNERFAQFNNEAEEDAARLGFAETMAQGFESMGRGAEYFFGESYNAFNGSALDDKAIIDNWDEFFTEDGELKSAPQMGFAGTNEIENRNINLKAGYPEVYKDYRDYIQGLLAENGNDIDKVKKIIKERSKDVTFGDRLIIDADNAMNSFNPEMEGALGLVAKTAPQIVGVLAAIVSGGAGAPALGSAIGVGNMGYLTASTMGQSMKEARDAGATNLEVWLTAIADGAIELVTEKIPFDNWTKGILRTGKGKIAGELVESMTKNPAAREEFELLLKRSRKELDIPAFSGNNIKKYLAGVAAEGASEFTAEALQTLTKRIYENPEDYPTIMEAIKNGWEGAKAGLLMGAVTGAVVTSQQRRANDARRKKQGFVEVASLEIDGRPYIGEIVGKTNDGGWVVTINGEDKVVKSGDIKDKVTFSYDEFRTGEIMHERQMAFDEGYSQEPTGETAVNNIGALEAAENEVRRMLGLANDADIDVEVAKFELTDEEAEAVDNYRKAKARFEGTQQRFQETRDAQYAESDRSIDERSNNGMIYSVNTKDGVVYITGGNLVLKENGSIDYDNSENLYAMFPDRTKKPVRDGMLLGEVTVQSAEELKAAARMEIDNRWRNEFDTAEISAAEQEKRKKGLLFNLTDGVGDHTIEVLEEGADDSKILFDGKEMPISTDELNQWRQEAGVKAESEEVKGGNVNVAPVQSVEVAAIPTEKRGKEERAAYHLVPIERTLEDLHDGALEPNEITALINARIKEAYNDVQALEKKKPTEPKKPVMGASKEAYLVAKAKAKADYEKAQAEWQTSMDEAQQRLNYYNELYAREQEITKSETREAYDNVQPREVVEMTADEFIANNLPKITPESFKSETGLSNSEQAELVGYIAGVDKGGVSVERAAEIIMESYGDELRGLGFQGDMQDVRDIIIDILSQGNPRSYAKSGIEQRRKDSINQQRAEIESVAALLGFESVEEWAAYEEQVIPGIIQMYTGFDYNEYYNNLAENYEYDTTRESETVGRGGELLQGEQLIDNTGAPVAEGNEGGAVPDSVQSDGANAQAPGDQQVNEPVGNSHNLTNNVKTEDVNQSENNLEMVAEGDVPGQSGVVGNNSANALQNGNNELNLQKENESDNESNQNDIPVGGQVPQSVPQGEHGTQASQVGGAQETAARLRERIESAQGDSKSGLREVENRVTREFAQENGLWIEDEFKLGVPFPSGDEHNNYIDAENQVVYKVNNRMHTPSILDLLDRIEQHNKYFPDSKYSLVGFTSVSKNGDVMPVFAQGFVPDARMATVDEIDSYMGTLGFTRVGDGRYSNGEVVIKDLKPRNVLADADGDIYVVDAEFEQENAQKGDKTAENGGEVTETTANPTDSESTEQPETNEVANAGPVNMDTLQLNMSDEDFNVLLNSGDKTAISEYLAEMDGLLRIGAGSPLDGQEALREEYSKAVEQYGKENIPAEVMDDLNSRMQPYSDLSRAIFDRKYALQDRLREIEATEQRAKELAEKEAKAEHKQTAFGGFLAGKTDLGASAAEKALNKKYDFDGKVMTVAEFVEEAVGNGDAKLSTIEEPRYKGASRAAWNRMDARQQEADEKRVKESGTKTIYTVNDHDLGKTAYDYAKFLLDKKAEQEKAAAKQMVKNLIQPFAKEKSEEIDEGIMFRTTYHGSGAKFDKFDHSYMGTGEGAQAYGWGTYVTEVEGIGRTYATTMRDKLISEKHKENATINKLAKQTLESSNGNKEEALDYLRGLLNESWSDKKRVKAQIKIIETGKFLPESKVKANLYTVEIPDDNGSNYLHWEDVVPDEVIDNLWDKLRITYGEDVALNVSPKYGQDGEHLYKKLSRGIGGDKQASLFLNDMGFVGISYPAEAMTGGRADGARNYVIFNEDDAVIEEHVMFRMSKTPQEFDLMQKAAVEKRGIVSPGLNNTAVNVVDVPRHDFVGSLKEARTKAKEWAVENYTGKEFDLPDNAGKYVISKNAIGKYLDKSAFDKSENAAVHLSVLKELPNVISNSIEVEIHADYLKGENGERNAENGVNRNDLLVHRIYGAVNIDGNTYRVKTTIHEFRDANTANTPHSYEVTKIELIEDSTVTPNDGIDNPLNRSVNSISATKLLEGVEKSYDKGKKVLDESENLTREGAGPLTDREVVMESDVYSKVLGKPRYYGKRQREFVARQRRRMAEKARLVAEKLNLNNVEVLESTEGLTGKKATSKGWFDPRTGKITVVVPNHGSTGDIVETVLHEAVAHYGLRKLFGENFKNFLDNVYNNVTPEIREEITELAKKHGLDFHTATEEYLASLAENTNFEKVNPSLWSNIKSFFMKMLAKVGITLDEPLGDNELRYILWRSHQNLVAPDMYNNVFAIAENIAKQYELGVGNYASGEVKTENGEVAAEEEIRFRKMNYDEAVQEAKNFEDKHKGSAPIVVLDGIENWEIEFIKAGVKQDEIERFRERLKTSSGNPKAAYLDDADLIFIFKPKVDEKDFNGYIWHENIHKAIREDDREGIPTLESALRKIFRDDFDATIKEAEEHGYIGEEAYEELACQLVQVAYLEDKMNANGLKGRGVFQDFINPLIKKIYGRGRGIVHEGVFEESNRANEKEFQGGSLATTTDRRAGGGSETETQATGAAEETRFGVSEEVEADGSIDDVKTAPLTLMERITNSLLEVSAKNKENLGLRADALRAYGRDMENLLKLMRAQREYDKSTVDQLVKLAKMYFKNAQLVGEVDTYTMGRILSVINNVVGRKDISANAEKLMDILMDAHNKALGKVLAKAEKVKPKKINASGVEVIGSLDMYGQEMVESYNAGKLINGKLLDDAISEAYNNLADKDREVRKKFNLDEDVDVEKFADEYIPTGEDPKDATIEDYKKSRASVQGYELAREYVDNIQSAVKEIADLEKELKDALMAKRKGEMSQEAYNEFRKSTMEAIFESKVGMIDAYHSLISKFSEGVRESGKRAKAFQQAQIDRVKAIQHNANSDMEGHPAKVQGKKPTRHNNAITRALMSPLGTFQTILEKFGEKAVDGKGYLYDRFMTQVTDAGHKEFEGIVAARATIEIKLKELFGKRFDTNKFCSRLREHCATVSYIEAGKEHSFELTRGQALYIYMANKMTDGQMKLRKMGITEEVVASLVKELPEKMVLFADWVQDDLMVTLRGKYNAVHERLFGVSMAAIENYFPLKIRKEGIGEKKELGQDAEAKPSTITGAIIKRTKNSAALDLSADAMQVLFEHIDQMEHWAAFAEFNRDVNSLINYRHFQNQVKSMTTLRYGSGDVLWKNFQNVVAIATETYKPERSEFDKAVLNITKGITRSKINFRLYTALKQVLSAPAFWNNAGVKELAFAYANPAGSIKWAMENLPGFKERWMSRSMGNEKLLNEESDWKVFRTKFVENATKWGMTPNAAVDVLTVAQGARAVYLTKLRQFKDAGYSEEQAGKKALQRAAESYNESQQSSEGAYLSAMQASGTAAAAIFTTFKNSSFGYTRKTAQAVANINRKMHAGYKKETIEFMKKKMMREGLTEEQAEKFATKIYYKSLYKDVADVALFGVGLGFLWNLGGMAIYLIAGDDDDEKDKMWKEIAIRSSLDLLNGIPFGETAINAVMAAREGNMGNIRLPEFIAFGDVKNLAKVWDTDRVKFANDLINMLLAAGVGVDAKTLTDVLVAIGDVEDWADTEELGMFALRTISAPSSQLDRLLVDDAMENNAANLEEVAMRYIQYKKGKDTPITGWMYSDEGEQEAVERYGKRFAKYLDERLENVVEDNDTFDVFYNSSEPGVKKSLSSMRQKFLAGENADRYQKFSSRNLIFDALEVLKGNLETSVEDATYFEMTDSEDVDAAYLMKSEMLKHDDVYKTWSKLEGMEKREYGRLHKKEIDYYKGLKKKTDGISRYKSKMKESPENAERYMTKIRKKQTQAIELINDYNNE